MAEYGIDFSAGKLHGRSYHDKKKVHLKSGKAKTAAKQSVQSEHEGHMKKAKIAIATHIIL